MHLRVPITLPKCADCPCLLPLKYTYLLSISEMSLCWCDCMYAARNAHAQSVFLNRSCSAGSDKQHDVGKCARIPTKVSACKGADWNGACQLVLFCSEELQPLAAGPSHRQRAPQAVSGDIKGQKTGKTTHGRDCTSEAILCLQDTQASVLLTAT